MYTKRVWGMEKQFAFHTVHTELKHPLNLCFTLRQLTVPCHQSTGRTNLITLSDVEFIVQPINVERAAVVVGPVDLGVAAVLDAVDDAIVQRHEQQLTSVVQRNTCPRYTTYDDVTNSS